jgi:predicted O-linked N-acetylglucosamine transferase (SPINDLY family)
LRPNSPEALSNLGVALRENGELDEAIAAYRQAIAIKADYADAYGNLCIVLKEKRQTEEAVAAGRQAIALKPDSPEAHNNLGTALDELGQFPEAIAAYRRGVALQPVYPEAHYNMGVALHKNDELDAALAAYHQAIAQKPGYPQAFNNLGNVMKDQGRMGGAIEAYRTALLHKADYADAHGNLVFAMSYDADYDASAIAAELDRWEKRHASGFSGMAAGPHGNERSPERRLRIGYVSPDFREHPVGRFLLPLFSHHDHTQVEIFAYSQMGVSDALTRQLRSWTEGAGGGGGWRDILGMSDAQVAELVRRDHIDILVDLALHTAGNRLLVFARKPAPVQVTFAGYPGSTGLHAIDYRLTDPYLDPPGSSDANYAEESVRLPHSFWCFDPQTELPEVGELPALKHGFVTFGCLNNFCKVNERVLELWAKVMLEVKESRLMLLAKEGSHRERTIAFLEKRGIVAERVAFHTLKPRGEYLGLYHGIDIGLDTLPYNGHTTSLDSFWMGVPVVTLVGKTVVGRAGLSNLSNLGLQELASETADGFIQTAVKLAGDIPRLKLLRGGLRARMKDSPLMDAAGFARGMEEAYRAMWRKWCGHG